MIASTNFGHCFFKKHGEYFPVGNRAHHERMDTINNRNIIVDNYILHNTFIIKLEFIKTVLVTVMG